MSNVIVIRGKCSTFGGPKSLPAIRDLGVTPAEGLALIEPADLKNPAFAGLFLPTQPAGTTGLARRLDPSAHYLAMRWDYKKTPKSYLRKIRVTVSAQGRIVNDVRPVDWGPNIDTGRIADLSPGLAAALGVSTDDLVTVTYSTP